MNYSEEISAIDLEKVIPVEKREIWDLKASPYDKNVIASSEMLEDDSVEIRILNIDSEQQEATTLGTLKTGLSDFEDPLVSL